MARVRPFAAWRYARPTTDFSQVVAPPYDVISPEGREALLRQDPHNVVALELPDGALEPGTPGNRYEIGAKTWDQWRSDGVLTQDTEPAIYVLEQRFTIEGREIRRRALIAEVELEPFDAGVILPHERTLPKALGDRFELIKATGANLSQVFGLFEDAEGATDAVFDAVMTGEPVAFAVDADGVESSLWLTTDPSLCASVTDYISDRQIFIADGHHRYTTALAYRDLRRSLAEPGSTPSPHDHAYDYVMMALVNMDDPDLAVLPYNRIADGPAEFDPDEFRAGLARHFDLTRPADDDPAIALEGHDRVAFLLRVRDEETRLAVLKDDVDLETAIPLAHSLAWKSLDVAVVQELVLWPLLGIHPDRAETLDRISFTKDGRAALEATSRHDVAIVLRPTKLSQLRAVSLSGETMPQKSTYFYPKLLSGLVFRSAD